METFIYGTGNPAKLKSMRDCLSELDIKIIGLSELNIELPYIEENGNSPLENARIKAKAYYELLRKPVFACDSGLYIDGLDEKEQPGTHIRNINGNRLNDTEMVEYYSAIAERFGGKVKAKYRNAICLIINENEVYEYFGDDISGNAFFLVDKPHPKRIEGFPLDCLSVHLETGEYYYWTDSKEDVGMMSKGFQRFFCRVLLIKGLSIRKYSSSDAKETYELFYDSIHEVSSKDYNSMQLDAWALKEMDLAIWDKQIQQNDYAVVAVFNSTIVGIASADDNGYIDLLYVHKDYQRMGIASHLIEDVEEYLKSKEVKDIFTDASITAKPFFEKRGYIIKKEQSVFCRGQFFTNYNMTKQINQNT